MRMFVFLYVEKNVGTLKQWVKSRRMKFAHNPT